MFALFFFLIMVSLYCLSYSFIPEQEDFQLDELIEERKVKSLLCVMLGGLGPINDYLLRKLKLNTILDNLRKKIILTQINWSPGEIFSAKEVLGTIFPLIGHFVFNLEFIPGGIVLMILGFLLPDFILRGKVNQVKTSIVRNFPETVDLLSLCVSAGLDFLSAVRWITDKTYPNPFIKQLKVILDQVNLGKPKQEAIRDMAKRLDIPDINAFARTLIQAERMGTPVEEAFTILSEDTRMRRFHNGQRQAMKASLKLLLPLIFCILPIVLITVAGPILIKFMTTKMF